MIRVIIAEVQNGDLKVEMNIIPDTLSCRHFIFSEQTVLMSSFSTGSPTMCECVRFFFFFPISLSQSLNGIVLAVTIKLVKLFRF